MRLIDADALLVELEKEYKVSTLPSDDENIGFTAGIETAVDVIHGAPTIDTINMVELTIAGLRKLNKTVNIVVDPVKEKDFVDEIIHYIFTYPDDYYMTIEFLCRKLYKHGLIDKKDGIYTERSE